MSVDFTTKNKQSLNVQYKDQDDLSLSSTIDGESVDITIGQPQVFDASKTTITDAKVLDDIVKDANLRYVASESAKSPHDRTRRGNGAVYRTHKQFSSDGEKVRFWENQGKDEGYDLIQPWEYGSKPFNPDDDIHCPVWDKEDAANPFTDGAFKFSIDQTDTGYIDDFVYEESTSEIREEIRNVRSHRYFYFGEYKDSNAEPEELSAPLRPGNIASFKNFATGSGPYTMYAVYAQSNVTEQGYYSPLWTPLVGASGNDADAFNPLSQGGKVARFYRGALFHNPTISSEVVSFTLLDGSRIQNNDHVIAHSFSRFQYPTTQSVAGGEVQIYVLTYTGTTDDKFSFFDIDSKAVGSDVKGLGSVAGEGGGTYSNVFGAPERMAYAFKPGDPASVDYKSAYNGSSIFVAEFGYFDKALDGQTASTLCRLLREKYKVD